MAAELTAVAITAVVVAALALWAHADAKKRKYKGDRW